MALEDIGGIKKIVDTDGYTDSWVGWNCNDSEPAFVAISLLSDNEAGDRFRWFVEEHTGSDCIVWIENINGANNAHYKVKVYAITG